jgi:hypothetical protein
VPPESDKNLGLKYFLNGALVSDIVIDVATDPTGLTATSTRTVIIELAAPPLVPDYSASTTIPAASSSPGTVASSTSQIMARRFAIA